LSVCFAVFCADLTRLAYDQADRLPETVDNQRVAGAAACLQRTFSGRVTAAGIDGEALELIRETTAEGMVRCSDADQIADTLDACIYHLQALAGETGEELDEITLSAN
jgi:hypothetical protein